MLGLLVGVFAIRFKPMHSNFQLDNRANLYYLSSYYNDASCINQYTGSLYNPIFQLYCHAYSKRVDAFSNHVNFDFDERSFPDNHSTAGTLLPSRC